MIALSFSKKNHPCCHVEKNLPCREEPTEKNSGRQGWLELKAGEMESVKRGLYPGGGAKVICWHITNVKSLKDDSLVFILSMCLDCGTIDQIGVL